MPTRRSFMICAGAAIAAQRVQPARSSSVIRRSPVLQWARGKTTKMRGLNCLQPFGYGIARDGSYVDEPYQNGGTDLQVMPESRLALLKSPGFDFVRMCIDPATLTTAADTIKLKGLIGQLTTGILRRLVAGLLVIADLHVIDRAPVTGWSNRDIANGIAGGKFQRYVAVAQELAAAIEALNALYTFHGYTPPQLTLQASQGIFRHIHALNFPPDLSERSAAIARLTEAVNADESLAAWQKIEIIAKLTMLRRSYGIDMYFEQPQNASYIATQMKIVTDWADSNRIPRNCIINGESGCNGDYNYGSGNIVGATLTTRANVIRALCQSGDKAGICGYVVHELQGSGFAVSDAGSFAFIPEIIAAMGIGS